MNKQFHLLSFLAGLSTATWILILIYAFVISKNTSTVAYVPTDSNNKQPSEQTPSEDDTQTFVLYNTDIKEFTLTANGKSITLHTPEKYFSLTDQYLENLKNYYGVGKLSSDDLFIVGDADTPSKSEILINVDTMSDTKDLFKQIYGDKFDEDEIQDATALTYIKTGEIPENSELNYKLEELESYTVGEITFRSFQVDYDTEYAIDATDSNGDVVTETIHTTQLACYSDTDDVIEIILFMSEFDLEQAQTILKEFLGVSEDNEGSQD